jgi:hypothetical protein
MLGERSVESCQWLASGIDTSDTMLWQLAALDSCSWSHSGARYVVLSCISFLDEGDTLQATNPLDTAMNITADGAVLNGVAFYGCASTALLINSQAAILQARSSHCSSYMVWVRKATWDTYSCGYVSDRGVGNSRRTCAEWHLRAKHGPARWWCSGRIVEQQRVHQHHFCSQHGQQRFRDLCW